MKKRGKNKDRKKMFLEFLIILGMIGIGISLLLVCMYTYHVYDDTFSIQILWNFSIFLILVSLCIKNFLDKDK